MNTSDATPDTSKKFQNYMVETAKKLQKRIVLPEGEDKRILSAAAKLAEDGLAYLTILGEEKEVLARVDELGLTQNPERIQIVSLKKSPNYEAYWKKLYEIRKEKGMIEAQA